MRPVALLLVLCAATAAAATIATPVAAQVRWDAGLQAGVTQRLTTGGGGGASPAPTPELGPLVEAQAHVALLPMVRVGLYAAEDLSPLPDRLRSFTAGGLHARIAPPLLPIPWRTWLYAGFGFAAAHDGGAAGTHAGGQLFDVPVGLGLGAKLTRHLMLFGELGARFGLGFYGPMYRAAPAGTAGAPYLGHDAVALALTVGLSWQE